MSRGRNTPARNSGITLRGAGFLGCAGILIACAYLFERVDLLIVGSFLAATPVLAWLVMRYQRPRLDIHRTVAPTLVTAGHRVTVTVNVANLSPRPLAGSTWQDFGDWQQQPIASGRLPSLHRRTIRYREATSFAEVSYGLTLPRRGFYELGPLTVTLGDPFGLARVQQLVNSRQTVCVVPKIIDLPDAGLGIMRADGSSSWLARQAPGGEHDTSTRGYLPGDPLRRVHWRASAHHGELMVRQEEQRSNSEATVVFDTAAPSWRHAGGADGFEWAVQFIASLVVHLERAGFRLRVHETGRPQLAAAERPVDFLHSMARATPAEPGPVATAPPPAGPRFAVLGAVTADHLTTLTATRGGVAFLLAPDADRLANVLRAAGWACVMVQPGDESQRDASIARAWADAGRLAWAEAR